MISGYAQNDLPMEAFNLFKTMKTARVQPDALTYATVVAVCATMASPHQADQIHNEALDRGINMTEHLGTSLISMYSKCGKVNQAIDVFNFLQERNIADITSWNAMIYSYGIHGKGNEGLALFHKMRQCGLKPNSRTFACILNCCSHTGLVTEALGLLHSMQQNYNITPEECHYTCVVDALGRAGRLEEAENMILEMNVPVSVVTYTALLGFIRMWKEQSALKKKH
jgi:pentatricopeptide repeat protein